jgi:hypothetical protein
MKAISVRLADVEVAMLQDLKTRSKSFRNFDRWVASRIREAYAEISRD